MMKNVKKENINEESRGDTYNTEQGIQVFWIELRRLLLPFQLTHHGCIRLHYYLNDLKLYCAFILLELLE